MGSRCPEWRPEVSELPESARNDWNLEPRNPGARKRRTSRSPETLRGLRGSGRYGFELAIKSSELEAQSRGCPVSRVPFRRSPLSHFVIVSSSVLAGKVPRKAKDIAQGQPHERSLRYKTHAEVPNLACVCIYLCIYIYIYIYIHMTHYYYSILFCSMLLKNSVMFRVVGETDEVQIAESLQP